MSKVVQSEEWGRSLFAVICRLLLSGVDRDVGLRCHVVTRPPVSRGRWWTAGHAVDWPEVRGGIEAAATLSDGLLLDAPDERWCARSTRHRGRAVVPPVLPSFLFGLLLTVTSFRWTAFRWLDGLLLYMSSAGQPALPLAGWQSW